MRVQAKIDEWHRAGLIDVDTAARLQHHESGNERPWLLLSLVCLGLLALALGILLVVASNWDRIAAELKIAVHLGLMIAVAVAVWFYNRRQSAWMTEGTLFLLGALTLAGLALHAQLYQLVGPLWPMLGVWAILVAPAVLVLGRTRLTAYGLGGMLVALVIAYNSGAPTRLGQTLSAALPATLVLAAFLLSSVARRQAFCDGLFDVGIRLTLAVGTLVHIAWLAPRTMTDATDTLVRLPLVTILSAAVIWLAAEARPRKEAMLVGTIMGGSLLASVLALGIAHGDTIVSDLAGLFSFLALWSGIAVCAERAGWFGLFATAVALLATRLFLIYFQLFYSLAFTGFGLIIAGGLMMAVAWVCLQIMRSKRAEWTAA
jgi:uncharacterized membrane protein